MKQFLTMEREKSFITESSISVFAPITQNKFYKGGKNVIESLKKPK